MIIKIYLCVYEIMKRIDLGGLKYPNCSKLACKRGKEGSGAIKCGEFLD